MVLRGELFLDVSAISLTLGLRSLAVDLRNPGYRLVEIQLASFSVRFECKTGWQKIEKVSRNASAYSNFWKRFS